MKCAYLIAMASIMTLLAGGPALAEEEPDDGALPEQPEEPREEAATEPGDQDEEPAPAEEPDERADEPVPAEKPAAAIDPFDLPDIDPSIPVREDRPGSPAVDDVPDNRPFARGDMEIGLGLGFGGGGDLFVLAVGSSFAYYVVDRLAPGLDLQYTAMFHDEYDYPRSFTTLPFLKFVLLRERRFAPYLILTGGREFQWGGSDNPFSGIRATDAWILGGGAGAQIGVGKHAAIRVQVLALYYWYDGAKIRGFDDKLFREEDEHGSYVLIDDDGVAGCDPAVADCYRFYENDDLQDINGELFFPLIHIGLALTF